MVFNHYLNTNVKNTISYRLCARIKLRARGAINRTVDAVGQAGSEFADGVSDGVANKIETKVVLGENLAGLGLQAGKVIIELHPVPTISVYFIVESSSLDSVQVRFLNEEGVEYGRAETLVPGNESEAHYFYFAFHNRVA